MPLLTWDEDLSVGIKTIDNQHIVLVNLINDLFHAMQKGSQRDELKRILSELHKYSKDHFEYEEKLMDDLNYPALEPHRKGHSGFIKKMEEFDMELMAGVDTLSPEMLKFLSDWIENHIKVVDIQYIDLFVKNGII